jgi:RNA polymerase sigma factor (sigma-70 family)
MTALPDWDIVSDAELAGAAAAGDRRAFAGIYDRYADRLHDFCVGMLRDSHTAADCVQDVFCIAADRLPQLRQRDKLRPWLYAIARNEALRLIRERGRERVSDQMPDAASGEPGPDVLAARTELADLIAEAAGGLSERDRAVLELAYRHGLDGPELAEALGVSHSNAKQLTHRLRETIEKSLGALLVSRRVQNNPNGCAELGAILDGWDGQFTVLMRKRISRHIESCPTCDQERRRLVNPVALLGAVPVFIPAPQWLRDRTLNQIQLTPSTTAGNASETPHPSSDPHVILAVNQDDGGDRHGRLSRGLLLAAALLAVVIATAGLTIAWLYERNPSISPANVTNTAPQPTSAPAPGGPLTAGAPSISPPPAPPTSSPLTSTAPPASAPPTPPPAAPPSAGPVAPTAPVATGQPPANPPGAPTTVPVRTSSPVATPPPPTVKPPAPPPVSPVKPTNPVVSTHPMPVMPAKPPVGPGPSPGPVIP